MRFTKRVILANGPRLLREMLHRVIDKAEHLEVVREVTEDQALPGAVETLDPEWVIVTGPFSHPADNWIREYPSVRFIFLSPVEKHIKVRWQTSCEEDFSDLSLKDLIHILGKDLQRT